jgi:hypothetical protein
LRAMVFDRYDEPDVTLLLVPVFYAIFVLDLKWITWDVTAKER